MCFVLAAGNRSDYTFDYVFFQLHQQVGGDGEKLRALVEKSFEYLSEGKVQISPSSDIFSVWPSKRQLTDGQRKNIPRLVNLVGNRILCSQEGEKCPAMDIQGFCSHTVTTALHQKRFNSYLTTIKRKTENLTSIATKGVSPNVGKKGKDTRKRKRAPTKKQREEQEKQSQQQQQQQQQKLVFYCNCS